MKYTIFLISSILLLSCTKNHENKSLKEPVLKEVTLDNGTMSERQSFYYSTDGLLDSIVAVQFPTQDTNSKRPFYKKVTQWNGIEWLKTVKTDNTGTIAQIIQASKEPGHEVVVRTQNLTTNMINPDSWLGFNAKGLIQKDSLHFPSVNLLVEEREFFYDQNDNIVKIEAYGLISAGVWEPVYTIEATYDNQQNPFSKFNYFCYGGDIAPFYQYYGKNNILTETYIAHRMGIDPMIKTFTYEYNDKGLPTKRINNNSSGEPTVITYKYQ